jgi:hypothetical protein
MEGGEFGSSLHGGAACKFASEVNRIDDEVKRDLVKEIVKAPATVPASAVRLWVEDDCGV